MMRKHRRDGGAGGETRAGQVVSLEQAAHAATPGAA